MDVSGFYGVLLNNSDYTCKYRNEKEMLSFFLAPCTELNNYRTSFNCWHVNIMEAWKWVQSVSCSGNFHISGPMNSHSETSYAFIIEIESTIGKLFLKIPPLECSENP